MTTASRATANLANAQSSTGSRTEAGKAVSSRNALKHRLTSQTVVLHEEDEAAVLFRETAEEAIDLKALDMISRHGSRLHRIYHTILKQARDLIDVQFRADQARLSEATRIRRAEKLLGRSTNLQEIGFVLSIGLVDAAIRRKDLLAEAEKVIRVDRICPKSPKVKVR